MEKRVLLAIALTFLVLYFYQTLVVRPLAPGKGQQSPAPAETVTAQRTPAPVAAQPETAPVPVTEPPPALVGALEERDIIVETKVVRAVFSNRGGELKSWKLKRYLTDVPEKEPAPADFLGGLARYIARQFEDRPKVPQELVPGEGSSGQLRPFRLAAGDPVTTSRLRDALYAVEGATGDRVDGTRQPVVLSFVFADQEGLQVRKSYRLEPESYVVRFSASVSAGGQPINPVVRWGPGVGEMPAGGSSNQYLQKPEAIFHFEGHVTRVAAGKVASRPPVEGAPRYAGVDDHYFLAAVLPEQAVRIDYQAVSLGAGAAGSAPREYVAFDTRFAAPPADARFFIGPKDFDVLAAVDRELVRVINYGIFSWLAVPLLRALKGINAYVNNYGWSIVILTFLINLVMFPLRHKSVVSMRRLQELQPEIKAIQERYGKLKATDPARQKMNQEMMALYKERGVNPASGCVPMLLTIPVLFAFYSLLSQAIEIRGAVFGLWIRDLSAHDPLYVTPILMGATMLWQQKITPTSADPAQQKIMMIMPLVFLFMFLWAPSGLVLYWFVSNLLAIAQQYVTNQIVGPPRPAVARPPATRQVRRVGSGRTEGAAKTRS